MAAEAQSVRRADLVGTNHHRVPLHLVEDALGVKRSAPSKQMLMKRSVCTKQFRVVCLFQSLKALVMEEHRVDFTLDSHSGEESFDDSLGWSVGTDCQD